jgi:hypothetical protein
VGDDSSKKYQSIDDNDAQWGATTSCGRPHCR